jgi:GTP-sensing pleiotropic transcriptional regulator CodY
MIKEIFQPMDTNNFSEILTLNNQQIQEKFNEMANDCLKMIETDQFNINSAEDLMGIFLKKLK